MPESLSRMRQQTSISTSERTDHVLSEYIIQQKPKKEDEREEEPLWMDRLHIPDRRRVEDAIKYGIHGMP